MSPKQRGPVRSASFPHTFEQYARRWWPRLEQHMWIEKWNFLHFLHDSQLEIGGLLKPQPNAGGGSVVRHMFMDVLDQALAELADLDAVHTRHPDVRITGEASNPNDPTLQPDDFNFLRCEVQFHLLIRH